MCNVMSTHDRCGQLICALCGVNFRNVTYIEFGGMGVMEYDAWWCGSVLLNLDQYYVILRLCGCLWGMCVSPMWTLCLCEQLCCNNTNIG